MSKSSEPEPSATNKPRSAAILLLMTAADTTWRIFLPTLGGLLLGQCLDELLSTKIIFTIVLVMAGFALGIALVMRQLKKVEEDAK